MRTAYTDSEACWIVLRRRGLSATEACEALGGRRRVTDWRTWESARGLHLGQRGRQDAKRYVVTLSGRALCWGSADWCAACLGVRAETLVGYSWKRSEGDRKGPFDVRRVMRAPCELMDGCLGGDPQLVAGIAREVHRRRRSAASKESLRDRSC